jgi:hypothetical protein
MNNSIPIREFTNEPPIKQSATLSFCIDRSRFTSCHAFLRHKRVVVIRSPLLMKWRNTKPAAIGNNIPNPLRPQSTGTRSALSAGYEPIHSR